MARITSAVVELYRVDSTQTTLATLTFDPTSFHVGVLRYVGGELEGLFTDFSNFLTPASDSEGDLAALDAGALGSFNPYTTAFSLIFIDGPRLAWLDCGSRIETALAASSNHHDRCTGGINSDADGFRPDLTVTRVAEPGSLALVGLALLLALPRGQRSARAHTRA
jgi:hypothetical protein